MDGNTLGVYSYVATLLNNPFGSTIMELVEAQFLVDRLLTEFEK